MVIRRAAIVSTMLASIACGAQANAQSASSDQGCIVVLDAKTQDPECMPRTQKFVYNRSANNYQIGYQAVDNPNLAGRVMVTTKPGQHFMRNPSDGDRWELGYDLVQMPFPSRYIVTQLPGEKPVQEALTGRWVLGYGTVKADNQILVADKPGEKAFFNPDIQRWQLGYDMVYNPTTAHHVVTDYPGQTLVENPDNGQYGIGYKAVLSHATGRYVITQLPDQQDFLNQTTHTWQIGSHVITQPLTGAQVVVP